VRKLTVLYDERCGFCCACRRFLERRPQLVELSFVPAGSEDARRRFGRLLARATEELVVVSDDGGVYRGERAYLMCLYALREFRALSFRLARPALLPLARHAFAWLQRRRGTLSKLLGLPADAALASQLRAADPAACGGTVCPTRERSSIRGRAR
jgi:predicted DCC family thiol-disulfide oxidoreductase YuxK